MSATEYIGPSHQWADPIQFVTYFPGNGRPVVRTTQRYGKLRNQLCFCKSGQKFKKCHGLRGSFRAVASQSKEGK